MNTSGIASYPTDGMSSADVSIIYVLDDSIEPEDEWLLPIWERRLEQARAEEPTQDWEKELDEL